MKQPVKIRCPTHRVWNSFLVWHPLLIESLTNPLFLGRRGFFVFYRFKIFTNLSSVTAERYVMTSFLQEKRERLCRIKKRFIFLIQTNGTTKKIEDQEDFEIINRLARNVKKKRNVSKKWTFKCILIRIV